MAAELEQLYRREGELPSDPDTEAETVQQVVRHIKAVLGNEVAVARDEARTREIGLIGTRNTGDRGSTKGGPWRRCVVR